MEGPISPYEFGNKAGLDSIHDFGSGRGYVKLIYRGTNVFHSSYGAAFLKMVNKLPHRDFGGMQFLPS